MKGPVQVRESFSMDFIHAKVRITLTEVKIKVSQRMKDEINMGVKYVKNTY